MNTIYFLSILPLIDGTEPLMIKKANGGIPRTLYQGDACAAPPINWEVTAIYMCAGHLCLEVLLNDQNI